MPEWPPKDTDYDQILKQMNFEQVTDPAQLREPRDKKRVIQVDSYPGVFRCTDNKLYDNRSIIIN